jgi:hypothetical protein
MMKKRQHVRNPFQITNYFDYVIERYCRPLATCGEIVLGEPNWCKLGFRSIESPFSLYSFTAYYVLGNLMNVCKGILL